MPPLDPYKCFILGIIFAFPSIFCKSKQLRLSSNSKPGSAELISTRSIVTVSVRRGSAKY